MALLQAERCALVTVQAGLGRLPWAAVLNSADDTFCAIERESFDAVFSDFGPLADGCSGSRLARALAARQPGLPVYLLSEHPELHRTWAGMCGAAGVLARKLHSLAQVMSVPSHAVDFAQTRSGHGDLGHSPSSVSDAGIRRLEKRLNEAGIGPAAALLVERAHAELASSLHDYPDLRDVACAVARHLPDGPDRRQFLREFGATA